MAGKRLRNGTEEDPDLSEDQKRLKSVPSFAAVIKEAMMAKSLQNFLFMLEPMLRKVVHEEVERGLVQGARSFQRSHSQKQIQSTPGSVLRLKFRKALQLPIFTGSKIEDEEGNPLQIFIEDISGGKENLSTLPSSIKIEIVVIDGDFPSDERDDWTACELEKNIVKERAGKRPLLTGDVSVTMRDGVASIDDLVITDNSSWIRSRRFRIAARVVSGSCGGSRIREAITESFVVKDHRGELYKKSYPPSLDDEVWRLERIGKEGAFHKRLAAKGINKVQDFLKLWVLDPRQLRVILGPGMSDKMWEGTISHANTCVLGNKLYLHHKPRSTILLNPICQVEGVVVDGIQCSPRSLVGTQKVYVEQMVFEAYKHWNLLEEIEEDLGNAALSQQNGLMLQGVATDYNSKPPVNQDAVLKSNFQNFEFDAIQEFPDTVQFDFGGSLYRHTAVPTPAITQGNVYNMSDLSSSDDDSNISHAFFQGS